MEAAAAEYNVTVFEAWAYLHHPQMNNVRALIDAGRLGDLQLITGCHAFYLPPEDRHNIRLNPALGGGGLWDVGIYPVSQSILLAGAGAPGGGVGLPDHRRNRGRRGHERAAALQQRRDWPHLGGACARPSATASKSSAVEVPW